MSEFTCSKCDICILNNHHPIIGDGNLDANIMFITRNPSAFDKKNNVPLVNKEGMLFQKFLDLFNFSRDLIYITNAVKCKTPGYRIPLDREIANCYEHLDNDIKTVNPKIIVLMGEVAIRAYFKLAYINIIIDMLYLNAKSVIANGRTIIYMIPPVYGLSNANGLNLIYQAFVTLTKEYRIINPLHETNMNI